MAKLPHNMPHNSMNLTPDGPGFRPSDEKTRPGTAGGHSSNKLGQGHDFNAKAKVTSNTGSSYHDPMPGSGAKGNFSEKDASVSYLKERGKEGQVINHYSGNTRHSREHTGYNGQTLYPSSPIDQVYNRATDCNDNTDPAEKKYK